MSRRRVLLACYHFPPVASVGSVRVGALAKYLPRHGWDVTVVTPARPEREPGPYEIVETEDADRARSAKRLLGLRGDLALKDQVGAHLGSPSFAARWRSHAIEAAKAIVAFPDAHRGFARLAARAAKSAARRVPLDAVLTSSPPVSAHLAGARIGRDLGLPWIADLRDLWTDDHNSTAPGWRRLLERRLERRTLGRASALVTVSAPLAETLGAAYPELPIHTILNGFDPELARPAGRLSREFTICHTGTFYQGRRDPTPLLDALVSLFARGRIDRRAVRVRLLSRAEPWLAREVASRGLADVVSLEPWVAWRDALDAQREAQVLLLLHWGGPAERGVYTGKVFEYLAARRPILMVGGGDGVLSDLLAQTRAGVHVRDAPSLEHQLAQAWDEFRSTGEVRYHGDPSRIERYSHDRMAREFARALEAALR
jgi:glycosyltransferase involved in cell wall biosynthesis